MASYTISESLRDGITCLDIAGDLDLAAKAALESQVADQLTAEVVTDFVIDISAVSFIDSAGIGALVVCRHLADDSGKSIRIVGAQGRIADILDLTGVRGWLAGNNPTS
jgi:anti-sigma B factor antagonist